MHKKLHKNPKINTDAFEMMKAVIHLLPIAAFLALGYMVVSKRTATAFFHQPLFACSSHSVELRLSAGFGGAQNNSSGNSKAQKKSLDTTKVRTISKNSPGAGTKPLRTAANTFDKIYKQHGKPCAHDLYVRSPSNDASTFWFVGKIARQIDESQCSGTTVPTLQEAVLSHKRLILEYAQTLRPQNLGGPFSKGLEVWTAPGNSELDVVQNKLPLTQVIGSTVDISQSFSVSDVGFNPEIYVGEEVVKGGLRVKRGEDGAPIKPVFEIPNLK